MSFAEIALWLLSTGALEEGEIIIQVGYRANVVSNSENELLLSLSLVPIGALSLHESFFTITVSIVVCTQFEFFVVQELSAFRHCGRLTKKTFKLYQRSLRSGPNVYFLPKRLS